MSILQDVRARPPSVSASEQIRRHSPDNRDRGPVNRRRASMNANQPYRPVALSARTHSVERAIRFALDAVAAKLPSTSFEFAGHTNQHHWSQSSSRSEIGNGQSHSQQSRLPSPHLQQPEQHQAQADLHQPIQELSTTPVRRYSIGEWRFHAENVDPSSKAAVVKPVVQDR